MTQRTNTVPIKGLFALWVKTQRAEQNLNKNQLATRSGVNRTTILEMEKHLRDPNISIAIQLIRGLGKNFEDFEQFLEGGNNGSTT